MSKNRRRFSPEYKFRVALDAAKGQETLSELASKYELHPNQTRTWKRQLLDNGAEVFSLNGGKETSAQDAAPSDLYEQIGRLKMELESPGYPKKKLLLSVETKRSLIEPAHPVLSLRRQWYHC